MFYIHSFNSIFSRSIVIFLGFFCGINLIAQGFSIQTNVSSLIDEYNNAISIQEQYEALSNLAKHYERYETKTDSAFYFSQLLQELGKANNDSIIISNGLLREGDILSKLRKFDLAEKKLREAFDLLDGKTSSTLNSRIYFSIANNFSKVGQLDSAVNYYNRALIDIEVYAKGDDIYGLRASVFMKMALAFEEAQLIKDAEKYFLLAEKDFNQLGDTIGLMIHYTNMVDFYKRHMISGSKYAEFSKRLLDIEKAVGMKKDYSHVYITSEVDLPYLEQVDFLEDALSYHLKSNHYEMIITCFYSLIDLHISEEKWNTALEVIDRGMIYSSENKSKLLSDKIHLKEAFLKYKLKILKSQSKYKESVETLEMINTLNDSISKKNNLQILQELNIKFESSEREKALAMSQLELSKKTNQRNVLVLVGASLLLLTYYIWYRSKQKRLISEQTQKLQHQQIEALESEKRIESMSAMIKGQEVERQRIAQDLHDGLGAILSSVKTHFSVFKNKNVDKRDNQIYDQTNTMLDQAVGEVRRISQNLMPSSLRINGLEGGISQLVLEMEEIHGIKTTFEKNGNWDKSTLGTREVFLFRIVQEAFNNITKHACAKHVLVQLSIYKKEINLIIEDDGIGFDTSKEYFGIGMKSIDSRVKQLNGEIDIDSRKGEGTTIGINVPIT